MLGGLLILLLVAGAGDVAAETSVERHAHFDSTLVTQLRAQDRQAAVWFTQAIEASSRGNYEEGAQLYARVHERVPGFTHALRREAMQETQLGHRAQAIAMMRTAVAADSSKENLSALAYALADRNGDSTPTFVEAQEAMNLATRAMEVDSTDVDVLLTLCGVAMSAQDEPAFRHAANLLRKQEPDEAYAHYMLAIAAALEKDYDLAQRDLAEAHRRGMPDSLYQRLSAEMHAPPEQPQWRIARVVGWTVGSWLALLALLFALGSILSRITLKHCEDLFRAGIAGVAQSGALLRRGYALILWASCAYYYVSIPLLVVLVLASAAGVVFLVYELGFVSVKLTIVAAIFAFVTVSAIVRSLAVRGSDEDPGERLDLAQHPKLRALLDRVAAAVGTRPIDNVYLTPATEVAVMERGGVRGLLSGNGERCLILGAGVLEGFDIGALKSVLAHEYGHLTHGDTAGGGFALAVRRSLLTMGQRIAMSGAATWYNAAWLFAQGFYRVFLRISHGASRLQEVMADHRAALTFGSENFERGLRHVIERDVRFTARAQATFEEVIAEKRPLANIYAFQPRSEDLKAQVEKSVQEAFETKPSPYDSHPAPSTRLAWIRTLAAPNTLPDAEDAGEAWELFTDRAELERKMTARMRTFVHERYGIEIAPDASPPEPA